MKHAGVDEGGSTAGNRHGASATSRDLDDFRGGCRGRPRRGRTEGRPGARVHRERAEIERGGSGQSALGDVDRIHSRAECRARESLGRGGSGEVLAGKGERAIVDLQGVAVVDQVGRDGEIGVVERQVATADVQSAGEGVDDRAVESERTGAVFLQPVSSGDLTVDRESPARLGDIDHRSPRRGVQGQDVRAGAGDG